MFFKGFFKSGLVKINFSFGGKIGNNLPRQAVSFIKEKSLFTRKSFVFRQFGKGFLTGGNRLKKFDLFFFQISANLFFFLNKKRILLAVKSNHFTDNSGTERRLEPQFPTGADSAADKPAENITLINISGENAVGQQKGCCPQMVGDNPH